MIKKYRIIVFTLNPKILLLAPILYLFNIESALAHLGPHASTDCLIKIEQIQLRFNGYQFHSKRPEKHFCRSLPELGDVIIHIDALQELDAIEIRLQWLELTNDFQLLSGNHPFQMTQQSDWKKMTEGLHSIRMNVKKRGIYGIKILLRDGDHIIRQQSFYFLIGFSVVKILVGISSLLLLLLGFIFVRQRKWNSTTR